MAKQTNSLPVSFPVDVRAAFAILSRGLDLRGDYEEKIKTQERALTTLQQHADSLALGCLPGAMIRFQVADGYAHYIVTSTAPLTVSHINWMDGYRIPEAHIRGLKATDIAEQVRRQRAMKALFASR